MVDIPSEDPDIAEEGSFPWGLRGIGVPMGHPILDRVDIPGNSAQPWIEPDFRIDFKSRIKLFTYLRHWSE